MARNAITTNKYSVKDYKFSAYLDGTVNGFIDSAVDAVNLNLFPNITISTKIKQEIGTTGEAYAAAAGLHNQGNPEVMIVNKVAGGHTYGYYYSAGAGVFNSNVAVKFNQWVDLTLVVSGTSEKLYLDGVLIQNIAVTELAGGWKVFNIGKATYGTTQTMKGWVSRTILCDYAMTATDVMRYVKDGVVLNNDVAATPVIDWKMTEGTGPTCASTGSLANSGTFGSGVTWTRDVPSQKRRAIINRPYSLLFPTTADYVNFGDNDAYDVTSAMTVEAWYYDPENDNGVSLNYIVSKWDTVTVANQSFNLYITSGRQIRFRLFLTTGGNTLYNTGVKMPQNKWCHLVATFTGTAVSIYLDGRLIYTTTLAVNTIQVGAGNLTLGSTTTAANTVATGQIASGRLWASALTTQQVEDLYFDNKVPTGAVMEALMTEGSGATVANTGSVGGTGAISGATWDSNSPGKSKTVIGTNRTAVA